jgi:hypothetical protein
VLSTSMNTMFGRSRPELIALVYHSSALTTASQPAQYRHMLNVGIDL